ncbi:hypothetical protein RFI_11036 [Reticulomyxa filosa]|uniref:Uncharacterized protein n=1 Tax=Reticulomyxa filosa TaxID=46433 RepID=X6NJK1_RETFI|nr:hypothetical protein RFI_11036 [Reticulomyxa filosa]|eukprot:ETO26103.1 hypothetical protein RFI_11036 [Reticulomyxa filosa]
MFHQNITPGFDQFENIIQFIHCCLLQGQGLFSGDGTAALSRSPSYNECKARWLSLLQKIASLGLFAQSLASNISFDVQNKLSQASIIAHKTSQTKKTNTTIEYLHILSTCIYQFSFFRITLIFFFFVIGLNSNQSQTQSQLKPIEKKTSDKNDVDMVDLTKKNEEDTSCYICLLPLSGNVCFILVLPYHGFVSFRGLEKRCTRCFQLISEDEKKMIAALCRVKSKKKKIIIIIIFKMTVCFELSYCFVP